MDAGALDRRVIILRPVLSRDGHNEEIAGEPSPTEIWASVRPSPGTERFASAETAASAPMIFRFRWRPDLVRVTDSIRHDGRDYAVLSVEEIGRRDGLLVTAQARGETA